MRVDTGLDSAEGIDALLTDAGLVTARLWTQDLQHQWDPLTYWELATGSGVNRMRLQQLDAAARTEVLDHAWERLDALPPDAFDWTGQVLCAVATRQDRSALS